MKDQEKTVWIRLQKNFENISVDRYIDSLSLETKRLKDETQFDFIRARNGARAHLLRRELEKRFTLSEKDRIVGRVYISQFFKEYAGVLSPKMYQHLEPKKYQCSQFDMEYPEDSVPREGKDVLSLEDVAMLRAIAKVGEELGAQIECSESYYQKIRDLSMLCQVSEINDYHNPEGRIWRL